MIDPFLVGKKIYLRSIINEIDAIHWYKWFNDNEVTYYMEKGYYPNTLAKQIDYFSNLNNNTDIQLAIIDKGNDNLIGGIGLHKLNLFNRNADISIIIGNKEYWGKGIGKEAVELLLNFAFNKLNLYKITAGMADCNKGSYNLFKKCGFIEEGRLKEQVFLNGKYCDIIKMGLY